jgi:hypothetical protein
LVTTRSCSLRGALRATALGVVSLAGLGVLLHLSLRDPLPPPIDPDTPFYEFRGEEALAPLPSTSPTRAAPGPYRIYPSW